MSPFKDLSPFARFYVIAVIAIGFSVLAAAVWTLSRSPVDPRWLALAAFTLVTGSVTVKVPSVAATLSVSEAFIFSAVILFGWAEGTVLAALEGLVISLWLQRKKRQPAYRASFNAAAPALSLCLAAAVYRALGAPSGAEDFQITRLILPLCGFAATYFLANSVLIAVAIALEQQLSAIQVWRNNFAWLWLNFFSGASVATLLVSFASRDSAHAISALWMILPLLGVSFFTYKTSMARIEDANKHLDKLNDLYLSTVETLAMAIDAKDQITHGHIRRVQSFAVALAKEVGITDQAQIKAIEAASLLHDMGKLAVPEYILNKPGPLTPAEFDRMKTHAAVGADILSAIPFPYPVVPIVRHHHEHWDGGGYPSGLKGTDIPIGARVLSVVDCFDALTSDRPYRPRLSDEDALQILRERRGTMYDPVVVDAFLGLHHRIQAHEEARAGTETVSGGLWLQRQEASFPRLAAITASAEESRVVYRLVQRVAAQHDLSAALSDVSEEICSLIPATSVALYFMNEDGTELEVRHVAGAYGDVLRGRRVRVGERVVGWSASSGRSVLNADTTSEFGELAAVGAPLRSCLTLPISVGSARVAVIAAFSARESAFKPEHQRVVEAVVRHVSPILERLKTQPSARPDAATAASLDLTPTGMIACRCKATGPLGGESLGMTLAVARRHLGPHAQTQIVTGNDIFIGTGLETIEAIEGIAEGLRKTLLLAGLIQSDSDVVSAITPRDGTNLEHLLYACRQRLAPGTRKARIH